MPEAVSYLQDIYGANLEERLAFDSFSLTLRQLRFKPQLSAPVHSLLGVVGQIQQQGPGQIRLQTADSRLAGAGHGTICEPDRYPRVLRYRGAERRGVMRRLKNGLLVALTLLLVTAGAVMPEAVSYLQDIYGANQSQTTPHP